MRGNASFFIATATTIIYDGWRWAMMSALWQRRPSDVIHHSDQGSQYTSIEFGKTLSSGGCSPLDGSVGNALRFSPAMPIGSHRRQIVSVENNTT
jgi:hypothetical protein